MIKTITPIEMLEKEIEYYEDEFIRLKKLMYDHDIHDEKYTLEKILECNKNVKVCRKAIRVLRKV